MTRPRVVLVGTMGAGKTTVGRRLPRTGASAFRDTDDDVEAAEGRSVSDIFVDSGEAHFRALERAAVAEALAHPRRGPRAGRRRGARPAHPRAPRRVTGWCSCGSG